VFKKKEYLTIFLIMVTEVLGFSLILPFLPFYVQNLGGTPLTVGLILTTFSLLQFVSAPIMGKLSDTFGRKPLLMISQFSTFISFVLLGFSKSIPMIFISRAVDGLLGSNAVIAQSYLSDISSKEDRSKAYGISGAAFGVGFLIGPAIGGSLAKISFSLPAFIAAGFSLTTIFMTKFLLKETVFNSHKKRFELKEAIKKINPLNIFANFKRPSLALPLLVFFAYIMAHTVYVSNFSLFGQAQFGITVDTVGYILAWIGFVSVVLRGLLLNRIIDKFQERNITKFGFISNMSGLFVLSVAHTFPMLFLAVTLFSIGSGLLRPMLMANISRNADEKRQGETMGVASSLGSIAQIIGPIVGGYALTYISAPSLPLMAVFLSFIGFLSFSLFGQNNNNYRSIP